METLGYRRPWAMKRGRAIGWGVVGAMGLGIGCNALIGLDLPEHEKTAPDLCAGVVCQALDACHKAGECDPGTGACTNPPAGDGMPCDDGDACTQVDFCQGAACVGADPISWAANGACQPGVCDPETGLCAAMDGASCNDRSCATTSDTCEDGVCNPGANHAWAHWVPDTAKSYVVTDDVVVDPSTGRTWQRNVTSQTYTWQDAQNYCTGLSLPGYPSGWRLPTRIELASIVDYNEFNPSIDETAFPNTPSEYFWSSSVYAGDPYGAWVVSFVSGYVDADYVDGTFRVRCVR